MMGHYSILKTQPFWPDKRPPNKLVQVGPRINGKYSHTSQESHESVSINEANKNIDAESRKKDLSLGGKALAIGDNLKCSLWGS